MKQYRSLAAHNAACNHLYYKYQDCVDEHTFGRFLGYCTHIHKEVDLCIREQREIKREANRKRSKRAAEKTNENVKET